MRRIVAPLGAFVLVGLAASAFAGEGDCRVIVAFKGDADSKLCASRGMDVEDVHGGLAVGTIPPGKIAKLRADADVAYVEEDGICQATAQTLPWGVSDVWSGQTTGGQAPTVTGAGIKVCVIDTGIDTSHPDLAVVGGVNFVRTVKTYKDDNGHGTHVAGTIAGLNNSIGVVGVAPGVSLYAAKCLDRNGSGTWYDVARAIDWAKANGMNVANMSLGGGANSTLQNSCNAAYDSGNGVLLIAAAGNSGDGNIGTTETSYPGAYASCVAVGATDSTDHLASFSNTGPYVAISAPGVSVYSTYKGGGYATLSGTSMATPHVVGLAALCWAEAGATNAGSVRTTLLTRVRTSTYDANGSTYDNGFGNGIAYWPH